VNRTEEIEAQAIEAARHNLAHAKRLGADWSQIRHLRANLARAEGTRYYPDKVSEGDRHWYVFDLLATGAPGPRSWVSFRTKKFVQALCDERNAEESHG